MMTNDSINKKFITSFRSAYFYDLNKPTNNSKQFLNYFNSVKLYSSILIIFILILIVTAFYFLCLYFKSLITRKDTKIRIRLSKDRSKDRTLDLEQSPESINQQSAKTPVKEPNLQPTTENNNELDEYRSIIASKLKPPPSTLDGLISDPSSKDSSIDVEIKQERDNDDVFSVISTKSLERYKNNKKSKNNDRNKTDKDKNKFDLAASETTDSEPDKIISLKSGSSKKSKVNDKKSKPIKKIN